MLTVLNAINLSAGYLEKKEIESPKFNAELLLAHILHCRRFDLYLQFDRPLTEEETTAYRELLKRRAMNEPLQYIIGSVEFYGLTFKVNSSALIPRPETEILIETFIKTFNAEHELKILDIGTGSGIIAVSVAKHLQNSNVTAIDISESALELAEKNAQINDVLHRINFLRADITQNPKFNFKFDAVISNPPYVSLKDFSELKPELKNYEPQEALTDNSDGLKFYKVISGFAAENLVNGGKLFFEIGHGQHDEITKIMKQNNFTNISVVKDYAGIERVISGELK